jgi:DNA primase
VSVSPALVSQARIVGRKHYTRLLADFERVYVFADGDQSGKEFATSLARELPVTIVQFPDAEDVNSFYIANGAEAIREKIQ